MRALQLSKVRQKLFDITKTSNFKLKNIFNIEKKSFDRDKL